MKKIILVVALVLVIFASLVLVLLLQPKEEAGAPAVDKMVVPEGQIPSAEQAATIEGRYLPYTEAELAGSEYQTNVLFFYAAWCPECRAFDEAIKASEIPDGVQILQVDYDAATDLRQQYGVTLQSTFVSVTADGAAQATWVGYGKDKSVDAILENL